MKKILGVIIIFYTGFLFGQKLPMYYDEYLDNYRETREYLVHSIDSTNSFYVLKTTGDNNPAVLIIFKESKQLDKVRLEINLRYRFRTYRHNDIASPKYEICHYVEEELVWCAENYYKHNLDLHFTDSMGNQTFEED